MLRCGRRCSGPSEASHRVRLKSACSPSGPVGCCPLANSFTESVHSHVCTPRLLERLRRQEQESQHRPTQDASKTDGSLWSRSSKLAFMDRHRIDASVVSVSPEQMDRLIEGSASKSEHSIRDAVEAAREANEDLAAYCYGDERSRGLESDALGAAFTPGDARANFTPALPSRNRLRAFGVLPLVPGIPADALLDVAAQIASLSPSAPSSADKGQALCGAVISPRGLGRGLGDGALDPLWDRAEKSGLTLFLHGHRDRTDLKSPPSRRRNADGQLDAGMDSVLSSAIREPFELAIATSQLILAGVLDRYPKLQILIANAGGALPVLASRLSVCLAHDASASHVRRRLAHDPRFYLSRLYFDAAAHGPEELAAASSLVGRAARYVRGGAGFGGTPRSAEAAAAEAREGSKRFLFGSDHPRLPPLPEEIHETSGEQMPWRSVADAVASIGAVPVWDQAERRGVMGDNALRILRLEL